jgi:hypothetical protein
LIKRGSKGVAGLVKAWSKDTKPSNVPIISPAIGPNMIPVIIVGICIIVAETGPNGIAPKGVRSSIRVIASIRAMNVNFLVSNLFFIITLLGF